MTAPDSKENWFLHVGKKKIQSFVFEVQNNKKIKSSFMCHMKQFWAAISTFRKDLHPAQFLDHYWADVPWIWLSERKPTTGFHSEALSSTGESVCFDLLMNLCSIHLEVLSSRCQTAPHTGMDFLIGWNVTLLGCWCEHRSSGPGPVWCSWWTWDAPPSAGVEPVHQFPATRTGRRAPRILRATGTQAK